MSEYRQRRLRGPRDQVGASAAPISVLPLSFWSLEEPEPAWVFDEVEQIELQGLPRGFRRDFDEPTTGAGECEVQDELVFRRVLFRDQFSRGHVPDQDFMLGRLHRLILSRRHEKSTVP